MKKIILVFVICFMLLFCGGCQPLSIEHESVSERSMFVVVETTDYWKVVYHKETKVMYAVSCGARNTGSFFLLVDQDGKPLLWQGE